MKRYHTLILANVFVLLCIGYSTASAAAYQLTWKSELSEGSAGICMIKLIGQPTVGAPTTINSWDRISLPFNSYTPQSLFATFTYNPAGGCAKLIVDAVCHIKPDGTEWMQKLEITPCRNRTIGLRDYGMRQY